MIKVNRSSVKQPEFLLHPRVNDEKDRIASIFSKSTKHQKQLRIKFRSDIFSQAINPLLELFHGKCAYCESDLMASDAINVEHFRPKQRAEQLDGTRIDFNYAWLAYEWENLLVACVRCNQRHREGDQYYGKMNMFPVQGPVAQPLSSVDECRASEKYLLIDPCFDQPDEHLAFEKNGLCRWITDRGKVTIDIIGLNREGLVKARLGAWNRIELLMQSFSNSVSLGAESSTTSLLEDLKNLVSGELPYTAVCRAAYRDFRIQNPELKLPSYPEMISTEVMADKELRKEFERVASQTPIDPEPVLKEALESAIIRPDTPGRYQGRAELPPYAHQNIRRVEISNFKVIEYLEFEFPEPKIGKEENGKAMMFLGENATGKSTILEALALALLGTLQIQKLNLDLSDFIRRSNGWGEPIQDESPAEVLINFYENESAIYLKIDPKSMELEGNSAPSTVMLGYGPRRYFPNKRRMKRFHEPAGRVKTLFDPLAVITNPTSWLMHCSETRFNAAVRALREVLLLSDDALVVRPRRGERGGGEITFEVQGQEAPLNKLSEGYKTILATSVDIMREMLEYWPDLETAKGIVMIDELETHLHPRWKMRIVDRLRRSMPGVQFVATTHDPLCLRGINDGEVQVLRRDESNGIEQLDDLPNVSGLSVEQLLTSDFFGLYSAEDPRMEDTMLRYVSLLTKHSRSRDEELEMDEYRKDVQEKILFGATPVEQIAHEALDQFLLNRQKSSTDKRSELKQTAIDEILDLWDQLDEEGREG